MANKAETTQSEFLRVLVETAVLALVTSGLMLAATSATTAQRSKLALSLDQLEWGGSNQLVQSKLIVDN